MPNKFNHPLMENNISNDDITKVIKFLKKKPILTQNKQVEKFEKEWSKWLGVKYSVFVNSGSSANFITISAIRDKLNKTGEIITPPLTWPSDVMAVINNGFKPKFVDINLNNLSMNNDKIINAISPKTVAVFMTHAQGFNGISQKLLKILKRKKIFLIEDVCESHGATFNKKKLGSYGLISNFSFYYAHHMSTIEGGMVCTNDKNIYELLRMFRSHGMVREVDDSSLKNKYKNDYPDLNPQFIFALPAFNVRNTEIGAILGRNQLKRLDKNNIKRNKNLITFLKNLNKKYFRDDFLLEGSSNYAFPLVLKKPDFSLRNKIEENMKKNGIEFRRGNAGGGNQMRQPYLEGIVKQGEWKNYPEVEHIHHFGWYIGNYPDLKDDRIFKLCKIINEF